MTQDDMISTVQRQLFVNVVYTQRMRTMRVKNMAQ
jgi:hypothetical protein